MNLLTAADAQRYLNSVDMAIGGWNQLVSSTGAKYSDDQWIKFSAPDNIRLLRDFSQHLFDWLPVGQWKILQIDNSNALTADAEALMKRILYLSDESPSEVCGNTFLFQFGGDVDRNLQEEALLVGLIFLFLAFECHAQIVSSNSGSGKHISIQDGFAYLLSQNKLDIEKAPEYMSEYM